MGLSNHDAKKIAAVIADCDERGVLTQNAQDELLDGLREAFPGHPWYRLFCADTVRVEDCA